ncbi:hypothetical protein GAY28_08855 [Azospirillum brasilense]|nr:hypothetical protein [Azospirillum brasilense]
MTDTLRRATRVHARGHWPAEREAGTVTLAFDDRHRRRMVMTDDAGADFLLDLPRAVALDHGDGLELGDGAYLRVVAADDLSKAKLHNASGEEMGSISELVVDPNTGRVAYAVVEAGGFLGLGERNFPVPWALVQPAQAGDGYVLNVTKDRLTAAPQFTRSNRPDMSDRQWAVALHTYYGVQPYWMRDGAALAAVGMPEGGAAGSPQLQSEVQRLSQEVDRLNRELSQARTLADTARKPDGTAQPGSSGSTGAEPAPGQGGSTPPAPQQ